MSSRDRVSSRDSRPRDVVGLVLCLLVAAGLIIDAVVHLHLAPGYQLAQPAGIGQGNLFRLESVVALLSAAYLLWKRSSLAFAIAAVVGFSALAAVLLTYFVMLPSIGPIPGMFEPVWFFEKALSAVAEAAVGVLAVIGLVRSRRQTPDRVSV